MKKIFLLLFTCALFLNVSLFAQNVKYTLHTLAQGETLSMLAEKYKTTVGDIMRLNGMHADTKLAVGQKIKIPASGQTVVRGGTTKEVPPVPTKAKPPVVKDSPPLTQTPAATTKSKSLSKELTHIVEPKETMYSISKKYGITVEQLQKWNYKKDNNLETGEVLAVSVDGIPDAIAKRKTMEESKAIAAVPDQTPPLIVNEPVNVDKTATEKSAADISAKENKAVEEKKPAAYIITEQKQRPTINAAADGSDNFFAKNFGDQASGRSTANKSGTAMIFKTASGWSDKKYYILMNDAPSGSIVKISAPNGNIVYAKVLWKLDDMKENKGLQFRISEAAAAALNVQDDKFPLTIQYYQ
ncbi:LysM peptidoglycan-binding domain-containing protein [Panacibacter ginsenosidivorans]|uniref:LysM peptidoglycan-binding domain-containing protein n=1 Tax=Panacibacter ginsenosidivorans TaxID=1813871 RepID=A0A5B8V6T7_9BACT|nr:LysM peptidoglycan-binding domain-containing protein [Panacibacter ginsenosidivorans]QEC67190.1 LysM peptidoglycan-binding domain-containing protein [Panacibacter ginsenosidivorans]